MIAGILDYLKREEFKKELQDVLSPIFSLAADQAKPYLSYVVILLCFHFTLLLCICFYLIKLKNVPLLTVTSAGINCV
jgi:hypothetical protein